MAKTDKGAAKAKLKKALKTGKVPKEIGGVRLSKPLRRSAEALIAEAKRPETVSKIAGGIAMAAMAAAAARSQAARPVPPVPPEPPVPSRPPEPPRAPDAAGSAMGQGGTQPLDPTQVVDALAQAARQIFGAVTKPRP